MKNILMAALIFVSIVSCNGKKDFSDEEYKKKQQDYEKRKSELNKSTGVLYQQNKQKLMDLTEQIQKLKDTTLSFGKTSKDTTYFKKDVVMRSINFDISTSQNLNDKKDQTVVNSFFLQRLNLNSSTENFTDPFRELEACYQSKNDLPCSKIKDKDLQAILDLKYVFIVDDFIKSDAVIKGEKEFDTGFYIGTITCYDILNKKPVYSFVVTAQNSNEISSFQGGLEMALKRDLNSNIRTALGEACRKHFIFTNLE
jgi:hypothetical protein